MRTNRFHRILAASALVAVVATGAAACEGLDTGDTGKSSSASKGKAEAPSKTVAEEFTAYVTKKGTANEKAAVKHVVKIQGAGRNNNILDTADIHTDYKGDLMDPSATGSAKLLASAFADFQASRGKSSNNGLVTVYNASGDMLSNGQY